MISISNLEYLAVIGCNDFMQLSTLGEYEFYRRIVQTDQ